jgi:hypothetical protein
MSKYAAIQHGNQNQDCNLGDGRFGHRFESNRAIAFR